MELGLAQEQKVGFYMSSNTVLMQKKWCSLLSDHKVVHLLENHINFNVTKLFKVLFVFV